MAVTLTWCARVCVSVWTSHEMCSLFLCSLVRLCVCARAYTHFYTNFERENLSARMGELMKITKFKRNLHDKSWLRGKYASRFICPHFANFFLLLRIVFRSKSEILHFPPEQNLTKLLFKQLTSHA